MIQKDLQESIYRVTEPCASFIMSMCRLEADRSCMLD